MTSSRVLPVGRDARMIGGVTRRGSSRVFVGRQAEVDRLQEAFARAVDGHPSLVLVAGDAGVGKTRLVAEFSRRVEATNSTTIAGGCLDLGEGGLPYAPFVEALRAAARHLDPAASQAAFGPSADVLGGLVPDLHPAAVVVPRADQRDAAAGLARLFDAVIGVLGRLAADRPLVLVLEDIHWADGSTRDLIRFLLRNLRDERLLIVATYRSDDLHRRHPLLPLLSELERADRVERLELRPFDRDELAEQLLGILGEQPSPTLVDALLLRSDGLPFYVEELVAGSADSASRLPSTLRDILGLRLATLSPASLALVRAAAVIRGRIPHDRLAAIVDMDENALIGSLREAIDARILVPTGGGDGPAYTFRHALLREAAYDSLLPAERVAMHARVADHLSETIRAQLRPEPSTLADFALHAYEAHDLPHALSGSVMALRAFIDVVAYREAFVHAERALELWSRVDAPSDRAGIGHADLLALAGQMASAANRPEQATALTQDALAEFDDAGGRERRASVLADLQWYAWESRAFEVSVAAAERAFELGGSGAPTRLKSQVTRILGAQRLGTGRLHESARLLETAMSVADEIDDHTSWSAAASVLAHAFADLGQAARAGDLLDRTSEAGTYDGLPFERIPSEVDRSIAALTIGRFDDAERFARFGLELATRYGWEARFGWMFRSCIVDALFELGRYDETEVVAGPALTRGAIHHDIRWTATTMARVAVAQGRLNEAHRLLDSLDSTTPTDYENAFTVVARMDLVRAEARHQDIGSTADPVVVGLDDREGAADAWALLGLGIEACADGIVLARRRRRSGDPWRLEANAESWLSTLRSLERRYSADGGGGSRFEAILATAEAETSRAGGAPDPAAWEAAADRWLGLSHPFQAAQARLRFAEALLLTGGDRPTAEATLRAAHTTVLRIGAIPLRVQIEELAIASRLRLDPTTPPPSVTDTREVRLTNRERDVLRLVAEGHTNREIGDRLFVSEKTASVHVSNAMAKLGSLSRYEAAAAANRQGLL
ncbi:MAG: transcriptional regulator, LuxR family [Chloroflexi bacterium]|nr:transcriptional regulator, LuxR family [Chloroflexota bacterium]